MKDLKLLQECFDDEEKYGKPSSITKLPTEPWAMDIIRTLAVKAAENKLETID